MQEEQEQVQNLSSKISKSQQENEKLAPLQIQNKKANILSNTKTESSALNDNTNKNETNKLKQEVRSYKVMIRDFPVCKLCKRKFNDDYSISLHEKFSQLHKVS